MLLGALEAQGRSLVVFRSTLVMGPSSSVRDRRGKGPATLAVHPGPKSLPRQASTAGMRRYNGWRLFAFAPRYLADDDLSYGVRVGVPLNQRQCRRSAFPSHLRPARRFPRFPGSSRDNTWGSIGRFCRSPPLRRLAQPCETYYADHGFRHCLSSRVRQPARQRKLNG
jgi:hypothetical protein